MKRTCQKIVLACTLGVALAACSSTGTSTDNGLIENNSDAAGVSAGEARLMYGASGTSGTGTASGTPTAAQPNGGTNNSGTHY
jgi:hypothetical protein